MKSLEIYQLDYMEKLDIQNDKLKTSIEEPPELELKKLLEFFEYVFLAKDNKFRVIILANLSGDQKKSLVEVLKENHGGIAWKITDIKGINPSFCAHKILMEENFK